MKFKTYLNNWTYKASLTFQGAMIIILTGSLIAEPLQNVDKPIPLWSGDVPGEKGDVGDEKLVENKKDDLVRLTNVTKPSITVYRPGKGVKNTGAAVLVCPGGGYGILAMSHEGTDVCEWLSQVGVTAVLLKYRVPRRKELDKHHAPLQDAQRAMSLIRKRSGEWGIDPDKIGVLGFSAGGHLAAMVMSQYENKRTYELDSEIDIVSSRPDFAILIYPAYLQDEDDRTVLDSDVVVNKKSPPVFLAVANNDKRFVEGSALLYLALRHADVPAELHIFAQGGHGFGMKKTDERIAQWPQLCEQWMRESGLLGK